MEILRCVEVALRSVVPLPWAPNRPGRSDIDVVAVISDERKERRGFMARLRLLHLSQLPRLSVRAGLGLGFSACCNTVFVWESDVSRPVIQIRPIASHVGEILDPTEAFDVNPVIWKQLVDGGISVRGDKVSDWDLDPEPEVLHAWVARNLCEYWTPLADSLGSMLSTKSRTIVRSSRLLWRGCCATRYRRIRHVSDGGQALVWRCPLFSLRRETDTLLVLYFQRRISNHSTRRPTWTSRFSEHPGRPAC